MIGNAIKRIFWVMAVCLVFCVLIFYQTFLTFLATWSVQAYTVSKWGKPLQYENISLIGNQLVIVQPRLENESFFTAERLLLNFHFNFWKRQIHIDVDIEEPHWHFQTPVVSQWEKLAKLLNRKEKWIKIHPHFHVKQGMLSWGFEDLSHSQQLNFDLEINNQEGGYVKLYFDPSEPTSNFVALQSLKSAHHRVELNCNCEKANCPSLIALAKFLGIDFSPCSITSGSLQGQFKAIFPEMQRPYLEGELNVGNLDVQCIETPLKGKIGQARLRLEKNQIVYDLNHPFPTTIGRIDILEPASLTFHSPVQEWTIDQIKGSIQLTDIGTALIDLQAQRGDLYSTAQWNLQGKANLNAQHSLNLDATLSCAVEGEFDGKIHFALNQLQQESKHMQVQCEKLSYTECRFLQTLLAPYWTIFNEVLIEDGEFNALIEADIIRQGIGELHIKQLEVFHLRSRFKSSNMICDFGQVRGYGKVQLGKEDFWQSLNVGLHLEDGQIEFQDLNPPLPMTDIQAHLLIQQGHIENSLVTLQIAGLKGKMDIEWGEHKQLLIFKLDGMAEDLADLFPNILQEGLRKHFYHNRIMVLANLKRQNRQIELDGTIHIRRKDTEQMDVVHFGCELKKNQNNLDFKYTPVGWFHAHKLPLNKFLSPFIFHNGLLQMSGEAEFKGSFDDRFLLIKYDVDDLKIENEDLCIEIPRVHSSLPGRLVGSYQMDLRTYAYQGSLPIQSASYFEKNTGLAFQDIQGLAIFKNDSVHILPIEAYCEGIYFSGEVELDYSNPAPGVFDVMIHCPTFSGKVSQVQHLLAQLTQPSFLHKIPLEGEVTGKSEGIRLKFSFVPDDYYLQFHARGMITEGDLLFEEADMALKGLDMDVDYSHQDQLLEFTDIQGTLLVGKPRRVEEYLFTGHHIRFYPISQPDVDLDIAIKDREHELLRLVGHTQEEQGIKNLYLNPNLSHISCIYPHVWQCRLKDWSNIEQFEFTSQFDLEKLLQDLRLFRQTGLLFLSHSIIDKISQFSPVEGKGFLTIRYHPDQGYTYHLEGTHIKQEGSSEHFGFLKGSKQEKKWIIDQLQWDDWSIYAELHQAAEKWRIPFLGLKAGQALLLGLEGDWFQEQALLRAKLKFCEVDLSKLEYFDILQPLVTKWWPKGTLNATGEIEWDMLTPRPLEGCKISLVTEVSDFSLRGHLFKILNAFQMKIWPYHQFCLENVQVELAPQNKQAHIDLKQFEYDSSQDSIHSLEAVFQIPYYQLKVVGETVHHHFPDILEASVKELLVGAKQQGQLKGMLTIENRKPSQSLFRLKLEDGLYLFKKREYDLKQFQLQIVGNEMQFSAFSQQERCPFQIIGQANWPSFQTGQCKLISEDVSKPLIIKWENEPKAGFILRSLQGELSGCSIFLTEDKECLQKSEWAALRGQVTIDFNRFSALLAPDVEETIRKLKLGSLYSLVGRFWMNLDWGATLLEMISFKGKLISQEAILKGYQMSSLQADLQYVPGRLDVQTVSIQDPAGSLKIDNCIVILDNQRKGWTFFVPRLTVRNLRLGLLRDTEVYTQVNSKFRSLILKRVEFQNLSGELRDLATWQAQGNLHFLNPSRKNFFHPLLAIPAEIILRLGLDPHVLNPVTGMIYFSLQGDRFYLNRFKDVYSEGRGSKFYLAQSSDPSWMDFDGNLSVHIRMKQYNLIFKIAELFTVSIHGNIKKPRYSLQKQSKASQKGKHS